MTLEKIEMKDAMNSPWINRILLGVVIYFAQSVYRDNQEMKINVQSMRTDIEVMKKEIQMLTDYKIDPKK